MENLGHRYNTYLWYKRSKHSQAGDAVPNDKNRTQDLQINKTERHKNFTQVYAIKDWTWQNFMVPIWKSAQIPTPKLVSNNSH